MVTATEMLSDLMSLIILTRPFVITIHLQLNPLMILF